MKYEFKDVDGKIEVVDTRLLDYGAVWDALGLKKRERSGAGRIINLYNSADFNGGILVVTADSWMKPYNREAHRHQSDHYRTRSELEKAAQEPKLVEKLINCRILKLHPRMRSYLERHPQAPYKLNMLELSELLGPLF